MIIDTLEGMVIFLLGVLLGIPFGRLIQDFDHRRR